MVADPIERLNYFQFQYLGAEDLLAQQSYHRDMRRRHNLGPHTAGIVTGLTLEEKPREADAPFVDVYVLPGICVDGYGRDIVVLEPVRVDGELFAAFNMVRHLDLWIAYDERAQRTAEGGFAPCTEAESYARVRETYRFAVGAFDPSHDEVIVAGRPVPETVPAGSTDLAMPADESIPYQDFPDDDRSARWLVRLGTVHWDGTVRKFRPAAGGSLTQGRRYAGFVGSALLAENGALRIAPRTAPADPDAAPFAALDGQLEVRGRITAKRNQHMHGGQLSFQSVGGTDENIPLWMQRLSDGFAGSDLRIHIGDEPTDRARLTVGPKNGDAEQVVLAVRGDNKIDIPTGKLNFGSLTRQHIDLWGGADGVDALYGIGVQSGAQYYRTDFDYYWYRRGKHSDGNGDPGENGARQMRLDAAARLWVGGGVTSHAGVSLWGGKLEFMNADGGTDTDPMEIMRTGGNDWNELRVVIGDNDFGDDRFAVGPSIGGAFQQKFAVRNNGDVHVAGNIYVRGGQVPLSIDVQVGELWINKMSAGSGTVPLDVTTTRLASISKAKLMVSLCDIGNDFEATGARWSVAARDPFISGTTAHFPVDWLIQDIDGHIFRLAYAAVLYG